MEEHDYDDTTSGASDRPETAVTVYCKLFSDVVTTYLCVLRRKELNAREGFSCEGCSHKQSFE